MIGSFWNLCRACPSMPLDKLHSEYRSTYRWHEFTPNTKQDVVQKPPAPNQFGPINEPPLPRRKKCPELAYKSHEFIIGSEHMSKNFNYVDRARTEERGKPSRRSKSEGPHGLPNGKVFPISAATETDGEKTTMARAQTGESTSGMFKKTISKLSTEYRLQFVWPRKTDSSGHTYGRIEYPRKSISMNAIKSTQTMPTVHKKRTPPNRKEVGADELEPLVNADERKANTKQITITEPKTHRPFSQFIDQERNNHFITKKENYGFQDVNTKSLDDNKSSLCQVNPYNNEQWYKEVIALRKKAGEYKCRGWGMEIDPDLYKKQKDIWDQVSKRSSLSALSLASSIHSKAIRPDVPILPARVHTIRHHLERTTGQDVEEGALLPSPTREKLMPAITKRESESQRGSPKKINQSKHGSPQKGSPQKGSPQKGSPKKTFKARSQSVASTTVDTSESPKRQMRSSSAAPASAVKKPGAAIVISSASENKPMRPSTLSTSIQSRSKRSSLGPYSKDQPSQKSNDDKNKSTQQMNLSKNAKNSSVVNKGSKTKADNMSNNIISKNNLKNLDTKLAESDEHHEKLSAEMISNCSPQLAPEETEHIVKSPPEPTRVKSPEQIIMRSPDPVNWTVPLDTGKTFTVTQNVKEGEIISRPQSEFKASTPVDVPLSEIRSAPPELAEQAKLNANKYFEKSAVPGSTIRCLDDPSFDNSNINNQTQQQQRNTANSSEVLEKARDRFDRFWGNNEEST